MRKSPFKLKPGLMALWLACTMVMTSTFTMAETIDSTCPDSFGDLNAHSAAKLCQIFETTETSDFQSISYFVAESPEQLMDYYQTAHPQLTLHSSFNQYRLLTMAGENTRIVISDDAQGTQVDILVRVISVN